MFRVYLFDDEIGSLTADRGRLMFRYSEKAVTDSAILPISIRLPKRTEPYEDDHARPFFENLLPEEEYRRLLAETLRLSEANTVGLLGAVGGECAGAVSIWPADALRPTETSYSAVSDDELAEIFKTPRESKLIEAQREGRLSLAGAQPKLTFLRADDRWYLPKDGAPTTHILKRTRMDVPFLVENEFFCMKLATAAGLPVPEVSYLNVGIPLLVVRRFDRRQERDGVRRIHQEDFCQAAGVLPANKYEAEGGPGLGLCAGILREHSSLPIADLPALVHWVAFNFLVGNEDAHAKNLALLYTDDGVRLAPFYDLVSSIVYKGLSRKAAMSIGGERRYQHVRRRHWGQFAHAVGLGEAVVLHMVVEVADRTKAATYETLETARSVFTEVPLIEAIATGVRERDELLRKELA